MNPLLINGRWLEGEGAPLRSTNPASGDTVWQGHCASSAQVDEAMHSAAQAFPAWAKSGLEKRQALVLQYQALLTANKASLAELISQETGKPLWETRTEVAAMIGKIDISIRAYHERTGTRHSGEGSPQRALTHRPHGVCAVFGPFNFPGHLPNGHIVPALLAGNCVVFKPSEQTPRVAEALVSLLQEAGLPEGVLSLLPGERDTAQAICAHPLLDGLFFTGSSHTGRLIHQQFASQPQKVLALEMGGNNPLVLTAEVDPRAAAPVVVQSAYLSAGQRCTCARRLLLPEGAAGDAQLSAIIEQLAKLRVAAPDADPQPFYATVISQQSATQLLQAQENLIALGAEPRLAMQALQADKPYLSPGVLSVPAGVHLPDTEYFGPLLTVQRYTDFDQAIALANQTEYGLSAGLISQDDALWEAFYWQVKAGIINRNQPLTGASGDAPFGGCGASGNHRPSAYYAADYCAYPVASVMADSVVAPSNLPPGLEAL